MKILVRNMSRFVSEDDLYKLFEKFGKIQYASIVLDKATGKSKGFGFVEMPKPGDAKAAIKTLNGLEIHGSAIRVKKVNPTPTNVKVNKPESSAISSAEKRQAKRQKSVWPKIKP